MEITIYTVTIKLPSIEPATYVFVDKHVEAINKFMELVVELENEKESSNELRYIAQSGSDISSTNRTVEYGDKAFVIIRTH